MHVVAIDLNADEVINKHVEHCAGPLSAVALDVTNSDAFKSLLEDVDERHGLRALFNIAGVGATMPFLKASDEEWDRILALNLRAVIDGTRTALALMQPRRRGVIVNMASVSGLVPVPFQTVYNTTKFAVVGLSTSLRPEAAAVGVQVNVVCPGNVESSIWGRPVIGPLSPRPVVPSDAVPADEAARSILRGVVRNDPVIVFPAAARKLARRHRLHPKRSERLLIHLYRQRAHDHDVPRQ